MKASEHGVPYVKGPWRGWELKLVSNEFMSFSEVCKMTGRTEQDVAAKFEEFGRHDFYCSGYCRRDGSLI